MPLSKYLTPSRTLLLQAASKEDALKELAAALCREDADLDRDKVVRLISEREKAVSSRIAPNVALPHCLLPDYDQQVVAVGYSVAGVPWDSPSGPPVNLVVMSLCGEGQADEHIRMLAELAGALRDPAILERMASVTSAAGVYETLRGPLEVTAVTADSRKARVCQSLIQHAVDLAEQTKADALMVLADSDLTVQLLAQRRSDVPLILVTDDARETAQEKKAPGTTLAVPFQGLRRTHRVKLAFLFALSHGLVDKGDTVVCVSGEATSGMLHALEIVDVAEEFHVLLSLRGELQASDISPHVLDRALHIATALAREGREGRPVGAIFVLGDYDNVQRRCHQLVMNPFRGYPQSERNLLDPSLEETIKEFSRIDGAFLVRGDGVIMSMGSCIQIDQASEALESGLGARHAAGMAITASTRALSIVISESTRRISLFRRGQLVLALDQALR